MKNTIEKLENLRKKYIQKLLSEAKNPLAKLTINRNKRIAKICNK
jgi:hypothetical protein